MRRRTKVKAAKKGRRKPERRSISLQASAEEAKRHASMEEILGLYRPRKKPITLRLDADVLAWFKKPGRGYQTRINRALRWLMREEKRELGE